MKRLEFAPGARPRLSVVERPEFTATLTLPRDEGDADAAASVWRIVAPQFDVRAPFLRSDAAADGAEQSHAAAGERRGAAERGERGDARDSDGFDGGERDFDRGAAEFAAESDADDADDAAAQRGDEAARAGALAALLGVDLGADDAAAPVRPAAARLGGEAFAAALLDGDDGRAQAPLAAMGDLLAAMRGRYAAAPRAADDATPPMFAAFDARRPTRSQLQDVLERSAPAAATVLERAAEEPLERSAPAAAAMLERAAEEPRAPLFAGAWDDDDDADAQLDAALARESEREDRDRAEPAAPADSPTAPAVDSPPAPAAPSASQIEPLLIVDWTLWSDGVLRRASRLGASLFDTSNVLWNQSFGADAGAAAAAVGASSGAAAADLDDLALHGTFWSPLQRQLLASLLPAAPNAAAAAAAAAAPLRFASDALDALFERGAALVCDSASSAADLEALQAQRPSNLLSLVRVPREERSLLAQHNYPELAERVAAAREAIAATLARPARSSDAGGSDGDVDDSDDESPLSTAAAAASVLDELRFLILGTSRPFEWKRAILAHVAQMAEMCDELADIQNSVEEDPSSLDQILAMVLSRYRPVQPPAERMPALASWHARIRHAWFRRFGCLPPALELS